MPEINVTAPVDPAAGTDVVILCSITTDIPLQSVVWEFRPVVGSVSNLTLSGNSHYSGGSTSDPNLTIMNATDDDDDGDYTCFATNEAGSAKGTVTVNVISMYI